MSSEFTLATLRHNGRASAAISVQDKFYILNSEVDPDNVLGNYPTCLQLLQQWSTAHPQLQTIASYILQNELKTTGIPAASAEILTPIIYPSKLLAIGANYSSHLEEMGLPAEKMVPMPYFLRPPTTSLVGPGKTVRKPRSTNQFDWELELVVVLSKPLRHAKTLEEAADAIAAYTVGLDLSCRDLAKSSLGIDVGRGKGQDTLAPCGPVIVPKENIKGGVSDLRLRLWVNDEQMIDASTKEMLYSVEEQLVELSRYTTLEPGDMLFTGTPAGGATSHGFRWLQIGDRIKAEIEQVGTLEVEIISDE